MKLTALLLLSIWPLSAKEKTQKLELETPSGSLAVMELIYPASWRSRESQRVTAQLEVVATGDGVEAFFLDGMTVRLHYDTQERQVEYGADAWNEYLEFQEGQKKTFIFRLTPEDIVKSLKMKLGFRVAFGDEMKRGEDFSDTRTVNYTKLVLKPAKKK